MSRQKELDTDPKTIQQKEFVGQSNQIVATKSMLVLTVLEKIIIANYQDARVKLTNTQLNKLKSAQKIRQEQY